MWNVTGKLISINELNNLNNEFLSFFNTFQRTVIIFKESIAIPIQNSNPNQGVFGLGSQQQNQLYTYTQVSQSFPALINYGKDDFLQELATESNLKTTPGQIFIKVQQNAMNYIENGKTVKINVDSQDFEIVGEKRQKTLLSSVLYLYKLQLVNK